MDRSLDPGFIAELLSSTSSPCLLAEMYFDDGTVRLTDAWRDITWSANTFTANGDLLSFSGLTESSDMQIPNVVLVASGISQAWVSIALTKPYIDRRLVIYKAFLDYTQSVITSPLNIFDGRMDGMTITDDPAGTCTVQITATSQWSDFDRRPGRHTNPAEQALWFPGDKFFNYCSQINKTIKWGAA